MSVRAWIHRLAVAALLLHSESARADEGAAESPRALNRHVFQPTQLLQGPFTATSFGATTLGGGGDVQAPRYDLSGTQIGTKSYTLATYGEAIGAEFQLTPDISLRLQLNALIFSGTGARGLLVVGATAQTGASVGLTAGKTLSPTTRLSFVADFGQQPQYSLLPGNAVLAAVQSLTFDDTGLFADVNRIYASGGPSFAWAPTPAFGFVAEARYVWMRRISNQESGARDSSGLSLAALLSFDLEPLIRWPVGFQAAYRSDFPVGDNGIFEVDQASFGVFYTRRVHLALGLEGIWRHGAVRPGVTPSLTADSTTAAIQFRYYW
jgi:hypothetical protein